MATTVPANFVVHFTTATTNMAQAMNKFSSTITTTFGITKLDKKKMPPDECMIRRGGPNSKIYCKIFKDVPHTSHIGRSPTGRWYTWEKEE